MSLTAAALAIMVLSAPSQAQLRVVNYNVARLIGNHTKIQNVLADIHTDDSRGPAVPVAMFVFVEVRSTDFATLAAMVNNSAPPGVTYVAGSFTNSNGAQNNFGGAPAMFYRSDILSEDVTGHTSIATGAGRRAERWKMKPKVNPTTLYNNPDAWFYVYGAHLKAGAGNEPPDFPHDTRWNGVSAIRDNADTLAASTHIIYCGDFNFYTRTEFGYLEFFTYHTNGNSIAVDPLTTNEWTGSANAIKHTQSPLGSSSGGLIGGGMDDRFDFQLISQEFSDNQGLTIIPNSYRAFGNDGNHYNQAINTGNNTYFPGNIPRSNALASNLNGASDHVPVVVDYQLPSVIDAFLTYAGPIIQNTPNQFVTLNLRNNPPYLNAGDWLDYGAFATGVVSGSDGDTIEPSSTYVLHDFPINTSSVGNKTGQVRVDSFSQGTHNDNIILPISLLILGQANPSFVSSKDRNSQTLANSFAADSGIHNLQVNVFNFGYNSGQSSLDVDSVSGMSPPFSFTGGLATGITTGSASLSFAINTAGLSPGPYQMLATIHTSDIDSAIGQTQHAITLTWDVDITPNAPLCPEDIVPLGGDGFVTISDINAVFTAFGLPCNNCLADIAPDGGDGQVTIADITRALAAFGPCPQ